MTETLEKSSLTGLWPVLERGTIPCLSRTPSRAMSPPADTMATEIQSVLYAPAQGTE
jgi:hypothetical protein